MSRSRRTTPHHVEERREFIAGRPCHYCTLLATTVDHIVPRAFGGPDAVWNYVPACGPCNRELDVAVPKCGCVRCTKALRRYLDGDRSVIEPPRAVVSTIADVIAVVTRARHSSQQMVDGGAPDTTTASYHRGIVEGLNRALRELTRMPLDWANPDAQNPLDPRIPDSTPPKVRDESPLRPALDDVERRRHRAAVGNHLIDKWLADPQAAYEARGLDAPPVTG